MQHATTFSLEARQILVASCSDQLGLARSLLNPPRKVHSQEPPDCLIGGAAQALLKPDVGRSGLFGPSPVFKHWPHRIGLPGPVLRLGPMVSILRLSPVCSRISPVGIAPGARGSSWLVDPIRCRWLWLTQPPSTGWSARAGHRAGHRRISFRPL